MTGMKLTMSMCFLAATVAIVSANYPPPSSPPTEDLGGGGAPPTVFIPGYINVWIKMGLQKLTKLSPCMAPDKGLRYAQDLVALFRYSGGPASVAFLEGVLKPIQYEMMTVYYPDTIAEAHETLPFWRWPKPNSSPNIEKFTKWCSRFYVSREGCKALTSVIGMADQTERAKLLAVDDIDVTFAASNPVDRAWFKHIVDNQNNYPTIDRHEETETETTTDGPRDTTGTAAAPKTKNPDL